MRQSQPCSRGVGCRASQAGSGPGSWEVSTSSVALQCGFIVHFYELDISFATEPKPPRFKPPLFVAWALAFCKPLHPRRPTGLGPALSRHVPFCER